MNQNCGFLGPNTYNSAEGPLQLLQLPHILCGLSDLFKNKRKQKFQLFQTILPHSPKLIFRLLE